MGLTAISLSSQASNQTAAADSLSSLRPGETSPVLTSLHWLPVRQRTDFKSLLLLYEALSGLFLCCYLCSESSRLLRWSRSGLLSPESRLTWRSGVQFLWSTYVKQAPRNCRSALTLRSFRSGIKTFLFDDVTLTRGGKIKSSSCFQQ